MKPITPKALKRMLEKVGYRLVSADDCTWVMLNEGHPAVIPQTMAQVPEDVLQSILDPAGIDNDKFAALLAEIEAENDKPPGRAQPVSAPTPPSPLN